MHKQPLFSFCTAIKPKEVLESISKAIEMTTRTEIEQGLIKLGLRPGDTVIVHSSLSSFGEVEGGAENVVEAILAVIGAEGTLVVPAFNFKPDVFDPETTPSVCGAITEVVRTHPEAIRSLHPTHSVAAIGALADVITEGHDKTEPFGRGSALYKVLQVNGKILQLGVTHTTNSMIHVAEELAGVPYLDRSRQVGIKTPTGRIVHQWVRRPGCSRGFDEIEEELEQREAIKETLIGDCRARLMTARSVIDTAVEMLKFDPESLLCEIPDCESCAEARAMISATEAEKAEKDITELAEEEERMRRKLEERFEIGEVRFYDSDESIISPN